MLITYQNTAQDAGSLAIQTKFCPQYIEIVLCHCVYWW